MSLGLLNKKVLIIDLLASISQSNKNPTSLEDLKVKSPTLIKIEDGKVTLYIEGIEEVKNELKK